MKSRAAANREGAMAATIKVMGDRIHIADLDLIDHDAARFVERAGPESGELLRRALKIGLTALEQTKVSLDIEFVRREFERLVAKNEEVNRRAEEEVRTILTASLGTDGQLPKTLDAYLGAEGRLTNLTTDLFDERLTTSAIAKFQHLLAKYFDGDNSALATLLDPSRQGSPLHQFAEEMRAEFKAVGEKLAAAESARQARAEERAKGTAKDESSRIRWTCASPRWPTAPTTSSTAPAMSSEPSPTARGRWGPHPRSGRQRRGAGAIGGGGQEPRDQPSRHGRRTGRSQGEPLGDGGRGGLPPRPRARRGCAPAAGGLGRLLRARPGRPRGRRARGRPSARPRHRPHQRARRSTGDRRARHPRLRGGHPRHLAS